MESHTMASENAEEQVSQAKPTLRDRNTVEDCEKVLYRFQGSLRPELYLDNCTENDFEQRPVGRDEKGKHDNMLNESTLKTEYWVLRGTSVTTSILTFPNRKRRRGTDWSQDQATKKSSYKERRVDAKAPYADEGRGKLRKAAGNCKQVMIRRYPNGGTQPE